MFRKICDESEVVNEEVCDEWKNNEAQPEAYDPGDIFKIDEIKLFYES